MTREINLSSNIEDYINSIVDFSNKIETADFERLKIIDAFQIAARMFQSPSDLLLLCDTKNIILSQSNNQNVDEKLLNLAGYKVKEDANGQISIRYALEDYNIIYISPFINDNSYYSIEHFASIISDILRIINYHCHKSEYILDCFDFADEGIEVIDIYGNYIYANNKVLQILNTDRDHIYFQNAKDISKNIVKTPNLKIFEAMNSGKTILDYEFTAELTDGSNLHLINNIYPVFNDKNEVVAACDLFRTYTRSLNAAKKILGFHATYSFKDIIGSSPEVQDLISLAKEYSNSNRNILICGESGTGKELLAQAIHNYSSRHEGPFIAINCASFPSELIDSELFGYEEGAFTGAKKNGSAGKFQLADGGTLFLDEIGEMPLNLQAKLLRVTETKSITRIGGQKEIDVNVRIIAATNRDLNNMVHKGEFRRDLFYRLSVLYLYIPPLRNRSTDIPVLAEHFLKKGLNGTEVVTKKFSSGALEELALYNWPGNIRELENVVYRVAINCKEDIIQKSDIKKHLVQNKYTSFVNHEPINRTHIDISLEMIEKAIDATKGNKKKAAQLLGISRRTLYRILERSNGNK